MKKLFGFLLILLCLSVVASGESIDIGPLLEEDSEEAIIAELKKNPENMNRYVFLDFPLLSAAVNTGRDKVAEFMLRNGAAANILDQYDQTPLFWCRNVEISKLLVQCGADPNYRVHIHGTPLMKLLSSMIVRRYDEKERKEYFDVVAYLAEITEVTPQDVEFIKEAYLYEGGRPKHLQNKLTPEDEARWQSLSAKIGLRIK
ncbi:MAG TPA: hypothetical protein PLK28_21300 [Candidatus Rifleibacterium sp.]|jgi:hypothetical protein|nr:hypothetical protein [Candidatus Rifleibacterium sp.]